MDRDTLARSGGWSGERIEQRRRDWNWAAASGERGIEQATSARLRQQQRRRRQQQQQRGWKSLGGRRRQPASQTARQPVRQSAGAQPLAGSETRCSPVQLPALIV